MLIISDINNYTCSSPTSVALGRFDGIHLAHKAVIDAAINHKCNKPLAPAVFTFEQSPHGMLTGEMVYSLLTTAQKHSLIDNMGVRFYFCPSFHDVKEMLPEEFVYMLKHTLNAQHISCGFNFTFGKYGAGNPALLSELCKRYEMELTVVPPVDVNGETVSSTIIRKYIEDGEMDKASNLLGYRFFTDFPVISGDKRGREMDFPTINNKLPPTFIHPKYGVYATRSFVDGKWYKSVSNVGIRPTVGADYPRIETHILDYYGDLYNKNVKIEFFDYLRPELHFSTLDELINAVKTDINTIRGMNILAT